jgi:pimeloyl-ACP methyl ester carboxylesterase
MAEDVISVLDANGIEKVDVVGWSDGGCIGYDLAIRFRSRIARLFAFGANMNHSCYPGDIEQVIAQPAFSEYLTRSSRAYEMFIPDSIERERAMGSINEMWSKEPNFDPKEMETITTPTTICLGQYDEAITIEHAAGISKLIQNSNIVILPNVSHFGLIQNPELFSEAVLSFLKWR